jgi:hypothetical protein
MQSIIAVLFMFMSLSAAFGPGRQIIKKTVTTSQRQIRTTTPTMVVY